MVRTRMRKAKGHKKRKEKRPKVSHRQCDDVSANGGGKGDRSLFVEVSGVQGWEPGKSG